MLVDDDEAINFINEKVIAMANCVEQVIIRENGQEAIDYLKKATQEGDVIPSIILLDINMPIMNGWEFVEAYKELDASIRDQISLNILSTSFDPADEMRAFQEPEIDAFKRKPLTVDTIKELHQGLKSTNGV